MKEVYIITEGSNFTVVEDATRAIAHLLETPRSGTVPYSSGLVRLSYGNVSTLATQLETSGHLEFYPVAYGLSIKRVPYHSESPPVPEEEKPALAVITLNATEISSSGVHYPLKDKAVKIRGEWEGRTTKLKRLTVVSEGVTTFAGDIELVTRSVYEPAPAWTYDEAERILAGEVDCPLGSPKEELYKVVTANTNEQPLKIKHILVHYKSENRIEFTFLNDTSWELLWLCTG